MSIGTDVRETPAFASSEWWTRAACVGYDPEWWSDDRSMRPVAVEICLICPVRDPCLADALRERDKGVVRGGVLILDSRRRREVRAIDLICSQCRSNPVVMTATRQDRFCDQCGGPATSVSRRGRRRVTRAHP